ncbi:MAG: hypothetical protein ABI947_09865 [Chloroflexota bacterium]
MIDSNLMGLINFNMQDLEANRKGFITHDQKTRIYTHYWREALAFWIFFLKYVLSALLAVIIVATIVQFASTGTWSLSWNEGMNTIVSIVLFYTVICGIVLIILLTYRRLQIYRDLHQGIVLVIRGVVHVSGTRDKSTFQRRWSLGETYSIKIADLNFNVSINLQSAFHSSYPYTIYYLPQSKIILSVE